MGENISLETLQAMYKDLESKLGKMVECYKKEHEKLEEEQNELKKKCDLCEMYEHMIKERDEKIKDISSNLDNTEKSMKRYIRELAEMESAIDTLSVRVARLKR